MFLMAKFIFFWVYFFFLKNHLSPTNEIYDFPHTQNFDLPFIVQTDASDYAITQILVKTTKSYLLNS